MVVFDQNDDGYVIHGREVDGLVKVACAGAAIADVCKSDGVVTQVAFAHDATDDNRDHRSQVGDHGVHAVFHVAVVHIAVATTGRAVGASKPLTKDVEQCLAAAHVHDHVADTGGVEILRGARGSGCCTNGFLSDADINAALNTALVVKANEALFRGPRLLHPLEHGVQNGAVCGRVLCVSLAGCGIRGKVTG